MSSSYSHHTHFHYLCLAKGRTNYELYPENYALRDGVAQTMASFKSKLLSIRQPTCQHQSCIPTPMRVCQINLFD